MSEFNLNAISPIDGRYAAITSELQDYFSEGALIKYRIKVEIEYFISLCEFNLPQLKNFNKAYFSKLREIYLDFNLKDALDVKLIEKKTNHDVKAVEYFVKQKFNDLNISKYSEFIHFGLTSQDVNNTAIPLLVKDILQEVYIDKIDKLLKALENKIKKWKDIPMLSRTHGQAASPTKLGKEINVFKIRIDEQLGLLKKIPISAKFGGATGNFNAHIVAYTKYDWLKFSKKFIEKKLQLKHSFPTTQIDHYDHLAAIFDNLKRINNILIDFNRDVWQYISMDYFTQSVNKNEVGSSAMPHKVNPIDFENSEGNLSFANSIFEFLSRKLPISRLQRDLTDSTVLRNIGVPFAHTMIALNSINKGLNKIEVNKKTISEDLENNWAVVAEAIQTILRRENYPQPYEVLKNLTRTGKKIDQNSIEKFIENLDVKESLKQELKKINPSNYTGI
ncbi:MAG: adenylosuccinate lyase [Bacteroidetes bacterium MED-G13]|nr:MAG: adenylosuccinate lyase [Bacteroidetes bacterium MED-G13]|tara:strand:+ start:2598 stop:3941 length:1344 start_codon:yes stop_codon:yes gene_type:complete